MLPPYRRAILTPLIQTVARPGSHFDTRSGSGKGNDHYVQAVALYGAMDASVGASTQALDRPKSNTVTTRRGTD